jgi:hypothetical protein
LSDFFFGGGYTNIYHLYGIMSGFLFFIFDQSIIFKQVEYINQSGNSCQCALVLHTLRFCRLIIDWLVENKTLDVTLCWNVVRCYCIEATTRPNKHLFKHKMPYCSYK